MKLQNLSVDELGGWATWMMGSLPNSDITPRVLGRAIQFVGAPGHPWPQIVGGRPVDRLSGPREIPAPDWPDCSFALPVLGSDCKCLGISCMLCSSMIYCKCTIISISWLWMLWFLRPWPLIGPQGMWKVSDQWFMLWVFVLASAGWLELLPLFSFIFLWSKILMPDEIILDHQGLEISPTHSSH